MPILCAGANGTMRIQAFGSSLSHEQDRNFDCFCLGPIAGSHSVRLDLDCASQFMKRQGLLVAVADSEPEPDRISASQILLDEFASRFYSRDTLGTDAGDVRRSVSGYLDEANQALLSRLADEERVSAMTTLAGFALLDPDVAVVFHIGDSRVLRDNGGYLRSLTEDHSQEKVRPIGRMREATYVELGRELTQYMGILGSGEPDVKLLSWGVGDTFLTGTKGWHGSDYGIAKEAVKTSMNAYHDVSVFVERSLKEAMTADGRTDASLVCVRIS